MGRNHMDMKELRKNAEKVIAERFPDFNFSTLDWGELDPSIWSIRKKYRLSMSLLATGRMVM